MNSFSHQTYLFSQSMKELSVKNFFFLKLWLSELESKTPNNLAIFFCFFVQIINSIAIFPYHFFILKKLNSCFGF